MKIQSCPVCGKKLYRTNIHIKGMSKACACGYWCINEEDDNNTLKLKE